MKNFFKLHLIIALSLSICLAACNSATDKPTLKKYVHIPPEMPDSVYNKLQPGDLVLRKGNGPLSFQIMNSTKEEYSHCGIIVKEADKWRVIHAMGGSVSKKEADGMQIMDLDQFVRYAADSMLYICRPVFQDSLGPKIQERAYKYLGDKIPFDHSFDLFHSDRIYCSELIFLVLRDITGKNQMRIKKQHKSYMLMFDTFFNEERYQPIFHLKDLGNQ